MICLMKKSILVVIVTLICSNAFSQGIVFLSNYEKIDLKDKTKFLSFTEISIEKVGKDNAIDDIPDEIFFFKNVKEIDFRVSYKADINSIFLKLSKLKKLSSLTIYGNNFNLSGIFEPEKYECIITIPDIINDFVNLEKLSLSGHLIKKLPFKPGKLLKLKHIELFRNKFTEFPKELLYLPALKLVGLENNYIKSLPKNLCSAKSLESVYVGRNSLKEIPECLLKSKKFKELYFNENFFTNEQVKKYTQIYKQNNPSGELNFSGQAKLSSYPKIDFTSKIIDKLIEIRNRSKKKKK